MSGMAQVVPDIEAFMGGFEVAVVAGFVLVVTLVVVTGVKRFIGRARSS